ncbi:hypothetical protein [Nonomuraea sp. NPDC049158]
MVAVRATRGGTLGDLPGGGLTGARPHVVETDSCRLAQTRAKAEQAAAT